VICGAAIVLALIFLIQTISLSGKLADATEEADRLRNQLNSNEDTSVTAPTDPSLPIINGLEPNGKEPHAQSDEITAELKEGTVEIELTDGQNNRLNTEILRFLLCRDGEDRALLRFTLQRQPGEEGVEVLNLQITPSDGVAIYTVQWHSSNMTELPSGEGEGSIFDQFFTSQEAITAYSKPIEELSEGENVCTLTGEDENGEELTITIYGIVIE